MPRSVRPLSRAALDLVDRLVDRDRFAARELPEPEVQEVLLELRQREELGAIPYLLPLVSWASPPPRRWFERRPGSVPTEVSATAAEVVGELTMAASAPALVALA